MNKVLMLLYNIVFVPFLFAAVYIASVFNEKIKRGLKDRKRLESEIKSKLNSLDKSKKRVWFHSSSMGEFEQAKPIIEEMKQTQDVYVIVSFFSPSGYENSKNYSYADVVTYIPLDSKKKCKKFLDELQVDVAVFMRYDIWPNIILELNHRNIPSLLVDATMRYNSPRKYGFAKKFHTFIFGKIDKILTVTNDDRKNFLEFGLDKNKVLKVGDTRYDRVYQKSLVAKDKKLFKDNFFTGKKVFVIGSAWEADEEVLIPSLKKLMDHHPELLVVIAPHEPTIQHLERLEQQFPTDLGVLRFSSKNAYTNQRVILIDSIGILLSLYYYADFVFVGGGYKQNVHNVLEPAVYGLPILFGPKIQNSQEALSLIEEGSATVIYNKKDAYKVIKKLIVDDEHRNSLGNISAKFVRENVGATGKILEEINSFL